MAAVFLILGIFGELLPVTLLALAILCWFSWGAIRFSFYVRWVSRNLKLTRNVYDDRGPVQTLWVNRRFTVRTTLHVEGLLGLPHLHIEEFLPFGTMKVDGHHQEQGPLTDHEPMELDYDIRPLSAGKIRFEGVRVELADLQGLFYHRTFVRVPEEILVLPSLVNLDTHSSLKKRQNTLMPPGIHQLAAPGSGSELLDLREYIPGDPPKTIAWKVSARRDQLITKEYESEVPLRCTLFVDVSSSVRVGGPEGSTLTRLVEIAASATQVNMSSRDLTGLCLFDEQDVQVIRPARNRRHLTQVLHALAEASAKQPEPIEGELQSLLPMGYSFAQEVYPERMTNTVNKMPAWLPFFAPTPDHWTNDAGWARWSLRWAFTIFFSIPYLALFGYLFLLLSQNYYTIPQNVVDFLTNEVLEGEPIRITSTWDKLLPPFEFVAIAYLLLVFLILPLWLKFFLVALPMVFRTKFRRRMKYRKRLAALIAQHYELGPGGIEMLFQDEKQLSIALQRFLQEHRVPFNLSMHNKQGEYVYARPEKLDVLRRSLLNAIGKGRDNELFVLFVDLIELEDSLETLMQTVKIALARHHQVMVILPWPPDFELPESDSMPLLPSRTKLKDNKAMLRYLEMLTHRRYIQAFQRIRAAFARLRVPVIPAAEEQSVKLILERMDRLRRQQRQSNLR